MAYRMHAKKLGFLLSMALVAAAILATRIQEVDVPIWQRFADANRVNSLTLHLHGEFVESNLGSAREPDGSITLRMIAEQYMFVPHCVVVPAGVPVHLRITSADVVHSLTFIGANYVVKVPAWLTKLRCNFLSREIIHRRAVNSVAPDTLPCVHACA
jgi:cytochrome c oxidase subunit 2